ncbi:hypothetical protein [Butyrivibrio sp. YAB3001]|uniref:hypothetical protein n=1 Tax=Butyrivibrio sp. YAB3001 TaxID=1520812 RepID=UPI0008F629A8|nr:hypothetical protein [Butyrivibrio sp. YAB3001]SFC21849.1 hypothetical protein SAMN02910398_01778 [Butyrivibrio sp. YAB3001]
MTIKAYLNPDFTLGKKLIFFLVCFIGIAISLGLIYLVAITVLQRDISGQRKKLALNNAFVNKVQRFFEMLIAGTSVLSFSCAYVIINHVNHLVQTGVATNLTSREKMLVELWAEGKDFVLLLLICLSCVINTILDMIIIPLKKITKEEKATIRMLAMFYVIILLMYLNRIGDESEYSPVMMYYFGLMIGRFVYFDASFKDFLIALKNMFFNLPYLILSLSLTGLLCYFGFYMKFLLERNYFIVGIFYTHLFLLAGIFLIHIVWMIISAFTRPRRTSVLSRSYLIK